MIGKKALLAVVLLAAAAAQASTIATFADPAADGSTPLFSIDLVADTITGGWTDAQTGLNLEIGATTYTDAWFTMTPLAYAAPTFMGMTGAGEINFYADGAPGTPLLKIAFASGQLNFGGLGGDNIFSGNSVVFSGSALPPAAYTEESFAFSFANQRLVRAPSGAPMGFTSTAAFTSSALPEPASLVVLALGMPLLFLRRSR